MAKKSKKQEVNYRPTLVNRKAKHEYSFLQKFEAGIVLKGTEVKSIRLSKVQLGEAYCYFNNGELFVKDLYISPYTEGNIFNVDPRRVRKLLLSRKELEKLKSSMDEKGLTIVLYKIFFNERNMVKLEIALAKGKKLYDKRHSLKEKDAKRAIDREMKF